MGNVVEDLGLEGGGGIEKGRKGGGGEEREGGWEVGWGNGRVKEGTSKGRM